MLEDKYIVRAWTCTSNDNYGFGPTIYKGTKKECLEFCRKEFIDAAEKLSDINDDSYELSLGFDLNCCSMRVTEITLYGRGAYEGKSYTRYYTIERDWCIRD